MTEAGTILRLLGVNEADFDIDKVSAERINIEKTNIEKTNIEKINIDKINIQKINIEKIDIEKTNFEKTHGLVIEAEAAYIKAVDTFLKSQDFLRLGRCIQGQQWHLVMSNSARMKAHCNELGITCFDSYLAGIRAAARRQDADEALQLMGRITAKRVQIRNLLSEDGNTCDI